MVGVFIILDGSRMNEAVTEFEALGGAATTVLNIGPAVGDAGPYGSYASFPRTTRLAMVILMWVSRIEFAPTSC